jgi:proteic killer suppression protein
LKFTIPNRKLSKRLLDPTETVKAFGMPIAKRISQRLREFEAAENLEVLRFFPAANCHELKGQNAGQLSVDISANYRLIIQPADDPPPLKEDGGLDWSAVTEILILDIVDYH